MYFCSKKAKFIDSKLFQIHEIHRNPINARKMLKPFQHLNTINGLIELQLIVCLLRIQPTHQIDNKSMVKTLFLFSCASQLFCRIILFSMIYWPTIYHSNECADPVVNCNCRWLFFFIVCKMNNWSYMLLLALLQKPSDGSSGRAFVKQHLFHFD